MPHREGRHRRDHQSRAAAKSRLGQADQKDREDDNRPPEHAAAPSRRIAGGRGIVGHRALKSKLVSKQLPLILWLASAPLVFALIFGGPVERAQEARVLETAREMV